MSVIGKIHEISFYGLITSIILMITGHISIGDLWKAAFHPAFFVPFFLCFLAWASMLFIPIAIVGALYTKFVDDGEGLLFTSENILVIMLAHIAEETLGLILTPIWALKYTFTQDWSFWKAFDSILYLIELIFIAIGVIAIVN